MISFDEALKIAKERKPNIDGYDEWDRGWVFSFSGDAGFEGGYGHAPVVITREGIITDMPQFVYSGKAGELRKSANID